jgi:hypothetical protein
MPGPGYSDRSPLNKNLFLTLGSAVKGALQSHGFAGAAVPARSTTGRLIFRSLSEKTWGLASQLAEW